MAKFSTDTIRNIVFAGHSSSGKTTLLEALLFKKGITTRMGRVEDKNTISDYEIEEKDRGYSIFSSVCHFEHDNNCFNIIDLPGYTDFVGAAYGPFRVVELAVIFVCATKGIEVNTKRFWDLAIRNDVPRLVVVSKVDGERSKFDEVLAEIQDGLSPKCKLIGKPVGRGKDLTAIDYVLDDNGDPKLRSDFIETALEVDDAMLEAYL